MEFDLTPDPKVLIALTHTPMQPLDALSELIDNAIDSFNAAELQGAPIKAPLIIIDLPKASQIKSGTGTLLVRDNGTGLSAEMAEKALRAGFSGNNPYDSLGLFGMGFNISTGKLGRVTRFLTSRQKDESAIQVSVDLEAINKAKSYKVPVETVKKPQGFSQGTLVEVSNWWPDGNPNNGFVRKLVQYGLPKVREEIGRRYATLLRDKKYRIVVGDEEVTPFEHCYWDDSRFVERKGVGKVHAVLRFNEVVGSQRRCSNCTALVTAGLEKCQICGSSGMRTLEERIRGWVGIQRFDDPTEYGVDLVRNGRAIRIGEKAAFFEFTDEFKRTVKDYPIDSPYGRIVGEVHINHVPVDFLKQDFQRNTEEWQRCLSYLRGDTSLQPSQPGADKNASPVFRLYQGYRRVRNPGRADLYMGYWDQSTSAARRIARDTEQEYYRKFKERVPGYYDDAEWWKLVEQADKKPLEELVECPSCGAQNLKGHDTCQACSEILKGKVCLKAECAQKIPASAASCPHCGTSQIPEVQTQWKCNVCGTSNPPDVNACKECNSLQGALHPLSREHLIANSFKSDDLSIEPCSIVLADGSNSAAINVRTYVTKVPITPPKAKAGVPLFAMKSPEGIEIFVDLTHRSYTSLGIRPEYMVAEEVALFVYDSNRRLSQHQGLHSLATITFQVLQFRWASVLEDSPSKLKQDIQNLFQDIRGDLSTLFSSAASDLLDDMDVATQTQLANNMLAAGKDLARLAEMRTSGEFLRYVDSKYVVDLVRKYPSKFFDGQYWLPAFETVVGLAPDVVEQMQTKTRQMFLQCLEDVYTYELWSPPDQNMMARARASHNFLVKSRA